MAWKLEGTFFENCSCDMVCPCTTSGLNMPADYERCELVQVFHIGTGDVDGTDVSGLTVALVADTPPLMSEGNWRVGLFLDAAASDEQAEKLGTVFGGQAGGPPAMIARLVGEMLGVERASMEYADEGRRHRVRVGDAVDIEIEDFVPPAAHDGEVSKLTGMFHPVNSTLTIAKANRASVQAFGLTFANEGKNGHAAPFSWAA